MVFQMATFLQSFLLKYYAFLCPQRVSYSTDLIPFDFIALIISGETYADAAPPQIFCSISYFFLLCPKVKLSVEVADLS